MRYLNTTDIIKDYVEKTETTGRTHGKDYLSTAYHQLDNVLGWVQPGELIIIGGRPGIGKTSLMLSMACRMAVDLNTPLAFHSLESDEASLGMKFIGIQTGIYINRLVSGDLEESEWKRLFELNKTMASAPICFKAAYGMDVETFIKEFEDDLLARQDVKAVFVDPLQAMSIRSFRKNREQELAEVVRMLKGMAVEHSVALFVSSQLSRSAEYRGLYARPKMSDLKDSGEIEAIADKIIMLSAPQNPILFEGLSEAILKDHLLLNVVKNRNGQTGGVFLKRMPDTNRFTDQEIPEEAFPGIQEALQDEFPC